MMTTKLDDKTRLRELLGQIQWKRAYSRRQSILEATEIFRILKTKKHEYDCFGRSLVNFRYGVEVVHIMKFLNKSYTDDPEPVFTENLKKLVGEAIETRDRFVAEQLEKKATLPNIPPQELRASLLQDLQDSQELISNRYKLFNTFFSGIMQQHVHIAAILEVDEEIKIIKSRISTCVTGLIEKKKAIDNLPDSLLVEFMSDDIDTAIEILHCQADNLLTGILESIEETNAMIRSLQRGRGIEDEDDDRGRKDGDSLEGDGKDGHDGEGEGGSEDGEDGEGGEGGESDESSSSGGSKDEDGADGDRGYLMAAVGKPLIQGLVNCALVKPADPICYISGYMRNYRKNEAKAQTKFEYLQLLLAERERIQLLKKKQLEEAMLHIGEMDNEEEGETGEYGEAFAKLEEA